MAAPDKTVSPTTLPKLGRGQEFIWLMLLVLVPLAINFGGQEPFTLPKVFLLRTFVWLLAALTLAEYLLSSRSLLRDLKANPLAVPVGLLAFILIITTMTAVNWRLSFWGSLERQQGAVTLLSYLLLFFLAANYVQSLDRLRRLLHGVVITAVPLVLIAGLQYWGWQPIALITDARSSIYATLGRSNFLGAYLAILTPLTLALALMHKKRRRWALIGLLLGELIVIILTLSRAAWLATVAALGVYALAFWGRHLNRRWQFTAGMGIGLVIFSGPLFVIWQGSSASGSTAARLTIWRAVLQLIRERPFLGYGADSLGLIFPGVYPPQLVYYQGRDFFIDRAHNLILDWAVTTGLPGLIAFLLVLGLFILVMLKGLRQAQSREVRAFLSAILAAVLAATANNLVSFDVTPTAMLTWFLIGAGVARAQSRLVPEPTSAAPPQLLKQLNAVVIIIIVGMAVWLANGRLLLAALAARSSALHAQAGMNAQAVAAAVQAVRQWPFEPAYHRLLSQSYLQQASTSPQSAQTWFNLAEQALDEAQRLRPEDTNLWLNRAELYTFGHQAFGLPTSHLADQAFQQALALAPNQAAIYTKWGMARLNEDDPAAALELLRQSVRLDSSSGSAFLYLGAAELRLGQLENALSSYYEASRLLPDSALAYAGISRCYWQLGQPREALQAVETALQHDPNNSRSLALQLTIKQAFD